MLCFLPAHLVRVRAGWGGEAASGAVKEPWRTASPDSLVVTNVPAFLSHEQLSELLSAFGTVRSLSYEPAAGGGGGSAAAAAAHAVCEYEDLTVLGAAVAGLNGLDVGGAALGARRGEGGQGAEAAAQETAATLQSLIDAHQQLIYMPGGLDGPEAQQARAQMLVTFLGHSAVAPPPPVTAPPLPPRGRPAAAGAAAAGASAAADAEAPSNELAVLQLANVVTRSDLVDDDGYQEILDEMSEECRKYGHVLRVRIPRPAPAATGAGDGAAADPPGVGLVFVVYEGSKAAARAAQALNGRRFGNESVDAHVIDYDRFRVLSASAS